jgi:multiple antibiotic resistance protein
MPPLSSIRINDIITISFTLFAIIDVIGSVPVVISFKQQHPNFNPFSVTAFAGALVVFILGLELISGHSFFKSEKDVGSAGSLVPLGFPILAGSGTLTTLLSLKAIYSIYNIVLAVLINLIVVFIVLRSVDWIERKLGKAGILVMKKFFGVILIAIAIKMFKANFPSGIL